MSEVKEFVIITDGCCDLPKAVREQYNIEYIKMHVIENERDIEVDLDWTVISAKDFYNSMRNGAHYRTVQVTIEGYVTHFERIIASGKDVLSISCSTALSGSYNASLLAREMVLEKYPDANIRCVDSLRGCMGQGLIAVLASKQRDEGKTLDQIGDWIEENRLCINQVGTVESLTYLKRAGRVTGMAAFMSGVFDIKPIIISNSIGMNESVLKVKGRKKSIRTIVDMLKETIVNPEEQTLFICHADCYEDALLLKEQILEEVKVKDFVIDYVGTTIGSTVGPGMLGVYYIGKKVDR